ncbi:MAG: hypothetical protein GXP05_04275 [Alphaproteobacteria bacterium]|nr:hypothetical protein [Alphaproteobacteria bacterium]
MSSHSLKSARRHPYPQTFKREEYCVAHMLFQVIDHPKDGPTFSLGSALHPSKPALFTGFVEKGMGTALRRLAHRFDELEAKL